VGKVGVCGDFDKERVTGKAGNHSRMESILLFMVIWAWVRAVWFYARVVWLCMRWSVVVWRVLWSNMTGQTN